MRKRLRIFGREEFWMVLLTLVLLVFSYGPLVYNYLYPSAPPGKVFLGSFGYPPDFWGNIINFQEGRLGHWRLSLKITTTMPSPKSLIKTEYRVLGHLSRFLPLDPIIFFHLCRFLLSLIFLLLGYQLITKVLNKREQKILRLVAYLLALFGTGVGRQGATFLELWSPLGVFQRSAYYPHYLFAFIFLFLTITFLAQALKEKSGKKLLGASLLGFLTGFTHAPNLLSLYLALAFYGLIIISRDWRQKRPFSQWGFQIGFFLIFFIISVLPLIYIYFVNQTYPWNLLTKNDSKFDLGKMITPGGFFATIGPTLVLSLYGSILILKRNDYLSLLLAPWSVVYIIGFFLINKITPYNSQRFLQTPFFVILGILSALALENLSLKIAQKVKITEKAKTIKEKILMMMVFVILLTSLPVFKKSLVINLDNFRWADYYTYFTPKQNLEAILWLGKNTQEEEIVLADKINGELIAALAGNFVYINIHATELEPDHFKRLETSVRRFYQQLQNPQEAKKFLSDNKIRYVFWAEEEKRLSGQNQLKYPFLKEVFSLPYVTIFEFKKDSLNLK